MRQPLAMDMSEATRKNIRDAWEAQKPDLEGQLSRLLGGVTWTIAVDPPALWARAPDDRVRRRLGACIVNYVQGALYQLGRYVDTSGAVGVYRVNAAACAHVLAVDVVEAGDDDDDDSSDDDGDDGDKADRSGCRCVLSDDGRLVVRIDAPLMGLNPVDALAPPQLERLLADRDRDPVAPAPATVLPARPAATAASASAAPAMATPTTTTTPATVTKPAEPATAPDPPGPALLPRFISMVARMSIRDQYDALIGEESDALAAMLHLPTGAITLDPNFLQTYHALLTVDRVLKGRETAPAWVWNQNPPPVPAAASWPLPFPMPVLKEQTLPQPWETRIGGLMRAYFRSLVDRMVADNVAGDALLREGFLEAVTRRRVAFRLVEAVPDGRQSDVVVEDGVLYLQTTADRFGWNIGDTADHLIERL